MNKELLSFDIFDTLITRKVAFPQTIFRIMQSNIIELKKYESLPQTLRENFAFIRIHAEKFVIENIRINEHRQVNFNDIYNYIGINYNLSESQINILKNLELSIEKNNIIPIWENINQLKEAYMKGYNVILISDMYLFSDIIKQILKEIDPIFDKIKIYVSCEYNSTKRHGDLYKLIKQEYKDVVQWTHFGDNYISDILQAKLNGIETNFYKLPQKLQHEKVLLSKYTDNYKIESIIGCTKSLRLNQSNNKYVFGVSLAAPILYNYTRWIIEQCLMRGIKNLYFVARDGFIPKQIADIIIKYSNLNIKTHYFYSSRLAARIVSEENYEEFIDCIYREKYTNKSIDRFLSKLSISLNELQVILDISQKELLKLKIKDIYHVLGNNVKLKQYIIDKNKEKSDIFNAYIKQEIDVSDRNIGFVDINGSGRTQDFLAQILYNKNNQISHNFYLHNSLSVKQKEYSIKSSYITTPNYIDDWIELLCRCPESQTIGYKWNENNTYIEPIKEYIKSNYMKKWGFDEYLHGILDYTTFMIEFETQNQVNINSPELFLTLFDFIKNKLDKKTADFMGSIPFAVYGNESKCREAAPKINIFNIFVPKHFDYISIARCKSYTKPLCCFVKKLINPATYGYVNKDIKTAYIKFFGLKINISNLIWRNQ